MNTVAQAFRDRLSAELRKDHESNAVLGDFIRELDGIDCAKSQTVPALPVPQTVAQHLNETLDAMGCDPALAETIRPLAEEARWYQLFEGEGIEENLARGLVAGQLAGQVGLVAADTIRAGLFLLAPGLHYPLHQHGALELYYVVSGRLTLQYGTQSKPFHVEAGNWSVTPSNTVHALTTPDTPCLVIYAWIGEVESPNWWWVRNQDGGWDRVCWERQPDAKWIQTRREAVTPEILKASGESQA